MTPQRRASDERTALAWLADVLGWAAVPEASGTRGDVGVFAALPDARHPKALVPLTDRRLADQALRSFNDSMSQAARLRRAAVGRLFRSGMDRFLKLDHVTFTDDGATSPTLLEYLEAVFGQPVEVSVALVPTPRPNRKPVLQVLRPDGRLLAFAKVGWNDLTRRLVSNEAAALRTLATADVKTFRAPELLHVGSWEGRSIVVTDGTRGPLIRRGRRNASPPIAVEREISAAMWSEREVFGSSRYLRGLVARIPEVLGDRPELLRRIEPVVDRVRDVSTPYTFGAWHGDWAPWNMSRSAGTLTVWDWERFGGPVPFGFDRAHLHFQVRCLVRRGSVRDAAGHARAALDAVPEIGVLGPDASRSILDLYLIEQVLRLEEGRSAGQPIRSGLVKAIAHHLEAT